MPNKGDKDLKFMPKSRVLLLSKFLLAFLVVSLAPQIPAQELDLNIPGLEEETAPAAPSSASSGDGGVSSGEVNLLDMIKAGGWSMWVLGAFSVAVIGLMVFCSIDLQKRNFHPDALVATIQPDLEGANLEAVAGKLKGAENCLSSVLQAGINHISEFGYEALGTDKLDEVMANAAKRFNRGRVRTINYFSVLAQAAPMMGLLGTVSGMIGAFGKLSQGGTGDPSKFAGNISEALITTASGLVIALPAIFCYFIFRDRLQGLVAECDEKAEDLMGQLRRAVAAYHAES